MAAVAATAERLITARQGHEWPPTDVQYDRWETTYTEAATGLAVIADVTEAVAWANNFIARAVAQGGCLLAVRPRAEAADNRSGDRKSAGPDDLA